MSSHNIEMSTDDTLELDAIIKEWDLSSDNTVTVTNGTKGTDFESTGLQTNTYIFDPKNAGTYDININGQKLTINVKDESNITSDDFEDNSLSEYDYTDNASIVQSPVYEGNYALQIDSSGDTGTAQSQDGFVTSVGDTMEVYIRTDTVQDISLFYFGIVNSSESLRPNDCYSVGFFNQNNQFKIVKIQDGTRSDVGSGSFNASTNTWYRLEIEWKDPKITARIYDTSGTEQAKASGDDTTFSEGGIGFGRFDNNYSGSKTFFDSFEVVR